MIQNEILKSIKKRRSCRTFVSRRVEDEKIMAVIEAGMWAPYSGAPDYLITFIQNREVLENMNSLAKESMKQSSSEKMRNLANDPSYNGIYLAPALIIISMRNQSVSPELVCGAITENMLLAAESIGLGACWIYFILQAFATSEGANLRKTLNIPENYTPYASVALGYKDTTVPETKPQPRPSNIKYVV